MSRLRGAGSVSGVNAFKGPGADMSTSGSWSMVDPPTPIKEGTSRPARTVHLAFSTAASEAAVEQAQGLVGRASSSSLLPSAAQTASLMEEVHPERVDNAALLSLVQDINPDAVYIGSARSPKSANTLYALLETLLSSPHSPKLMLAEPSAVRTLSTNQASALHELAETHSIHLSLPIRWGSLWSTTIDETLFGLELLTDMQPEQAQADDEADETMEKFDISLSNIPTGLSGDVAELEALRKQVKELQEQVRVKDGRIEELLRHKEQSEPKAGESLLTPNAAEDPSTTPHTPATPAFSTPLAQPPPASPAQTLPPSSSQTLLCALASPSAAPTTPSRTPTGLGASAPISPASPSTSKGTSKVISSLTAELAETKQLLEATRSALSSTRLQSATYQAAAEEMRSTLSRARLENDSSITILARKDRQISEALERARKAEGEAKELGRASREWGTRVREVEEELGKERIKRSRAEQAYDSLSSEWKGVRERLLGEVKELKDQHREKLEELKEEYKKINQLKEKLREEWSGYGGAGAVGEGGGDGGGPRKLLSEIKEVNSKMEDYLRREVAPLMEGLKEMERRENVEIVDRLKVLTDELTRIKTLMRRGEITSSDQVPPSPL